VTELSVLIPARNEQFLARTIQDILEHSEADTEIVAVLDGQWAEPRIPDNPRVTLIYHAESIGQRAATNEAARIAAGKWVMKCDAHCSFAQGFDKVLLADMQDDWTCAPLMKNLHAFNWVCKNGHARYQGPPGPCKECGLPTVQDVVWISKKSPNSTAYCFDTDLHFQYHNEMKKRPEGQGPLSESMSLQGSCFMLSKEKYFGLNICDETWGSWGNQGSEVAIKTWLSGGRIVINQKTFYSHLFRTQPGFGFPYAISGKQVAHARHCSQELFLNNKWDKQIYPLSWLIKKFWPVPGWTEEDLSRISMSEIVGMPFETIADKTTSRPDSGLGGQGMTIGTMGHSGLDVSNRTLGCKHVFSVGYESQVERVTAGGIITNMVKDEITVFPAAIREGLNQPCINQTMDEGNISHKSNISIPEPITSASPDPTIVQGIIGMDYDPGKDSLNISTRQIEGFGEILTSSHLMSPYQISSRLESGRCDGRSDLFIIPYENKHG